MCMRQDVGLTIHDTQRLFKAIIMCRTHPIQLKAYAMICTMGNRSQNQEITVICLLLCSNQGQIVMNKSFRSLQLTIITAKRL